MTTNLKAHHLDALASMIAGRTPALSFEGACALYSAGLITADFDHGRDCIELPRALLTEEGWTAGRARAAELAGRKARRNATARATAATYRDLGMRRTRDGGWE